MSVAGKALIAWDLTPLGKYSINLTIRVLEAIETLTLFLIGVFLDAVLCWALVCQTIKYLHRDLPTLTIMECVERMIIN
jgi:hypothetical protein